MPLHAEKQQPNEPERCACSGGCAMDTTSIQDAPPVAVSNTSGHSSVFRIPAMDCPNEENDIRKALAGITGIRSLRFELATRTLTIDGEQLALESGLQTIRQLGFEVLPIEHEQKTEVPSGLGEISKALIALALAIGAEALDFFGPDALPFKGLGMALAAAAIAFSGFSTPGVRHLEPAFVGARIQQIAHVGKQVFEPGNTDNHAGKTAVRVAHLSRKAGFKLARDPRLEGFSQNAQAVISGTARIKKIGAKGKILADHFAILGGDCAPPGIQNDQAGIAPTQGFESLIQLFLQCRQRQVAGKMLDSVAMQRCQLTVDPEQLLFEQVRRNGRGCRQMRTGGAGFKMANDPGNDNKNKGQSK